MYKTVDCNDFLFGFINQTLIYIHKNITKVLQISAYPFFMQISGSKFSNLLLYLQG